MKVKGIIQGKSIQLSEAVSVPDGTEVMVEIPDRSLNQKIDQWQKLQEVIGAWKDDPEIEQIFTEIDREPRSWTRYRF
ncbi:hypothetical protein [Pleurocapsa sp. FMAR1]|uniref:hypothetical protein n=1 Tax=Pleurocapsa sp. FMAR1 TaxID=3040204 RepID=UPI0029C8E182|nr:hypothetical protein [Pleurocapsa sp. FMAR1]